MEATITIDFGFRNSAQFRTEIVIPVEATNLLKARAIALDPDIVADRIEELSNELVVSDFVAELDDRFERAFADMLETTIVTLCEKEPPAIELRDGISGETRVGLFGDTNTFIVDADDADQFAADLCNKLDWPVDCIEDLRETDEEEAA